MKIYIIGPTKIFIEKIQKALESSGQKDVTTIVASKLSAAEVIEKVPDCEILIASPGGFKEISKEMIVGLPKLKLISTISVGTDWVDIKAAKEHGVIVSNEKGVNAESVAEHCFGMILDLSKRITEADRGIREKGEFRQAPYMGQDIYGKTLGIVGIGDIGQRVARIAKGFSMHVLGFNQTKQGIEGIEVTDLEKLLKESDVLVVTIPFTADTENLLAKKEFASMKDGVILVSISREKIINTEALQEALNAGRISGFGFDADIESPIDQNSHLLQNQRVLITPHTASMTEESDRGYIDLTVENVNAFLNGKPVRVVN